jgi:hypothetical protein
VESAIRVRVHAEAAVLDTGPEITETAGRTTV